MFKNKIIVLYIVVFSIVVFLPSLSSVCYLTQTSQLKTAKFE